MRPPVNIKFCFWWPKIMPIVWLSPYKAKGNFQIHRKYTGDEPNVFKIYLYLTNLNDMGEIVGQWPLQRSARVIRGQNTFLSITFDRNEIQPCDWPHCAQLVKMHQLICHMAYLSHQLTLIFDQILTLIFQGHLVYRYGLKRLLDRNTIASELLR